MTYDLIIIGGGTAGVTAAIYAARYKLNFILISESVGGWLNEIHKIENYPGFSSISGFELIEKYEEQLKYLNVPIVKENVVSIEKNDGKNFTVNTNANTEYSTKSIIIASGSRKQTLNIPGEKEFLGRGVSYCAICDAMFFKGKKVAVIGGANSAISAALHLSKIADHVYLIYRKDKLRADSVLVESAEKEDKIDIIFNTNLTKINGKDTVESIKLDNEYNEKKEIPLDGVFIEVGLVPIVNLVNAVGVELDGKKQIKIDEQGLTNIPGIFAAGDVTNGQGELKQLVTAAAAGAIAAASANKYLG
ncbi:MAG: FAD-dependent oxidoreductase [bacterium]